MLYDRMAHFHATGKSMTICPSKYKKEHPWLKEIDSLALANTQLRLEASYREFFREKRYHCSEKTIAKAKRQNRALTFYDYEKHPKFKPKRGEGCKSYTTNNQNGTIRTGDQAIKLPKIGWIRCEFHRPIPSQCAIKSATVSQTATGKYFVSVLIKVERSHMPKKPKTSIGLRFDEKGLYTASDGSESGYEKLRKEAEAHVRREQRKLAKMQKGGKNYQKQKRKLAKAREKEANRREDFLHKLSGELAQKYDIVRLEEPKEKNGVKTPDHSTRADWEALTRFLAYKQRWNGHHVVTREKRHATGGARDVPQEK